MIKKWTGFLLVFLLIFCQVIPVSAASFLVPVGRVIGLELQDTGVTVAGVSREPAPGGLQIGDRILSVNQIPVKSTQEVKAVLEQNPGTAELCILRDGTVKNLRISPADSDGNLGIYLKDRISGVGTVTWYDPDTHTFGALGHGITTPDGQTVPLTRGIACEAQIQAVRKGKAGAPGQLIGSLDDSQPLGELKKNTPRGIFGAYRIGWPGEKLPVAQSTEIHKGPAVIRSTVSGQLPAEYSVEILRISPGSSSRNLVLKVTDPALLSATGGIVQGMSGSPIIQDGKLIGAVTHVMVSDPTTGYGIFIGNMLDAAA